jgi:hypothetical protein
VLGALAVAVGLLHLGLADWAADRAIDIASGSASTGPSRLKALFVTDLRPAAPAVVGPAVAEPVPPRRVAAARPASAASAPDSQPDPSPDPRPGPVPDGAQDPQPAMSEAGDLPTQADAPAPAPAAAASEVPPEPPLAAADPVPPLDPAALAASAPSAPPFEWPRSTRLSYVLTGFYRGPVDGQASVEWLREGSRYQVHLEVSVGPSFAPLLSRRMSSDGLVGPDGLTPLRYDEETHVALRSPRGLAVHFEGPVVRLANGGVVPRPTGVQDTASQFVQLTWLFTTQPERLRPGQSVDLMLALPRRVELWTYDVQGDEVLNTPAGVIDTVHVRPRRPARAGDLTAEVWIAPSLQFLPVRIVIRQDAETFVDLLLNRLPQQAAAEAPR